MQQRVEGHQRILQELERARLFRIRDWMSNNTSSTDDSCHVPFSTRDNRLGPSTGTSALCTMLRMGMRAQCAIINAGAVRGNKVYNDSDQYFCWSDLKAEIPFSTSLTACYIPGRVLEATIAYSRRGSRHTPPQASGGYLHTCRNIVFNDQDNRIESIGGKPLDPNHEYLTALPVQFFAGIDNHQPLLDWAALRSNYPHGVVEPSAPLYSEESAIPAKMVLVQVFSALVWLQLGTFDEIDQNQDGVLQYEEVAARVSKLYADDNVADLVLQNLFSVADLTGDGTISPLEMMIVQFAATDLVSHVCTGEELQTLREVAAQVLGKHPTHEDVRRMVQQLFATLDLEGDGKIQRHEVMKLVGRLNADELLQ
jgi:Ca2+-binding EF-hand superfamily protein